MFVTEKEGKLIRKTNYGMCSRIWPRGRRIHVPCGGRDVSAGSSQHWQEVMKSSHLKNVNLPFASSQLLILWLVSNGYILQSMLLFPAIPRDLSVSINMYTNTLLYFAAEKLPFNYFMSARHIIFHFLPQMYSQNKNSASKIAIQRKNKSSLSHLHHVPCATSCITSSILII